MIRFLTLLLLSLSCGGSLAEPEPDDDVLTYGTVSSDSFGEDTAERAFRTPVAVRPLLPPPVVARPVSPPPTPTPQTPPPLSTEVRDEVQETQEELEHIDQRLDELLLRLEQAHPVEYQQVQAARDRASQPDE